MLDVCWFFTLDYLYASHFYQLFMIVISFHTSDTIPITNRSRFPYNCSADKIIKIMIDSLGNGISRIDNGPNNLGINILDPLVSFSCQDSMTINHDNQAAVK